MATTQLQLRRGDSSSVAAFCGAEGELIYDTTNKHLRVHDGHKDASDQFDHHGVIIPNRDEVVRKTGNATETITGTKIFSLPTQVKCSSSEDGLIIYNSNVTDNVTKPSSNTARCIRFTANDGSSLGNFYVQKLATDDSVDNVTRIIFRAYNPTGNAYSDMYYCNAGSGKRYLMLPESPAADSGTTSYKVPTIAWVNTANNGTTYSNNLVHITGTETISGTKTFSAKLYANGGVQGTASSALWADLAEQYIPDEKYPVGTLIKFGGEKDITIADDECNGIISERPGFLLDCGLEDSLPVALVGKTRVRVVGEVKKFDKLVLSEIPGIARAKKADSEKVIGIALDSSDNKEEKLVMSVVKVEF